MPLKTAQLGSPRHLSGRSRMVATGMSSSINRRLSLTSYVSCFNAFSRVDIRIEVKIPGGVAAYVIDLRGERYVHELINRARY